MDMQGALRARLVGDLGVSALVGSRVYWVSRPQGSILPAVTLQVISDGRPQHMKGFEGFRPTRVQVDVWSETYAAARSITEAVIAAIAPAETANGIRFDRAFVDSIRDLGEQTETRFLHRTSLDLIVHHAEA